MYVKKKIASFSLVPNVNVFRKVILGTQKCDIDVISALWYNHLLK